MRDLGEIPTNSIVLLFINKNNTFNNDSLVFSTNRLGQTSTTYTF